MIALPLRALEPALWLADAASRTPAVAAAVEKPNPYWALLVAVGLVAIYAWGQSARAARVQKEAGGTLALSEREGATLRPKRPPGLPRLPAWGLGAASAPLPEPAPRRAPARGATSLPGRLPVLAAPATARDLSELAETVGGARWGEIVAATLEAAEQRCEACDEAKASLTVLPIWTFDDARARQSLKGLIALCGACADAAGDLEMRKIPTLARLSQLNGWTSSLTRAVLSKAQRECDRRAHLAWTLDLEAPLVAEALKALEADSD